MKVLFLPEVEDCLYELIEILYYKEYFGFKESAIDYVRELKSDIVENLPICLKKSAPKYFTDRYEKGMKYAVFRKSKRTSWHVFFTTYLYNGEEIYLVRYISNNHVIAQYL
jgi:hypothetical protein